MGRFSSRLTEDPQPWKYGSDKYPKSSRETKIIGKMRKVLVTSGVISTVYISVTKFPKVEVERWVRRKKFSKSSQMWKRNPHRSKKAHRTQIWI